MDWLFASSLISVGKVSGQHSTGAGKSDQVELAVGSNLDIGRCWLKVMGWLAQRRARRVVVRMT